MDRRTLIAGAAALATAARAADRSKPMDWPIGAFNRVFADWTLAEALDGIRAAGYPCLGLVSPMPGEPLCAAAATPESIADLRRRIDASGLEVLLTSLRFDPNGDPAAVEADIVAQVRHAALLGVPEVMTFGIDGEERYERYLAWMRAACRAAGEGGLNIVIKPHGGICADAAAMLRCLDAVGEPNFKIWYDAGNIVHYTGKDPVAEAKPIAEHVTGFCAKDCPGRGGEVMIDFGEGRVDFRGVFEVLAAAGFRGPILVEGVRPGPTHEETIANAGRNREFLVGVLGAM